MDKKFVIPILAMMLFLFPNLALSEIVVGDQYVYTYAKIYFQVSAPPTPPVEPVRMLISLGISVVAISYLFRHIDIDFSSRGISKLLAMIFVISALTAILTLI